MVITTTACQWLDWWLRVLMMCLSGWWLLVLNSSAKMVTKIELSKDQIIVTNLPASRRKFN
jgi:hypothetical protein